MFLEPQASVSLVGLCGTSGMTAISNKSCINDGATTDDALFTFICNSDGTMDYHYVDQKGGFPVSQNLSLLSVTGLVIKCG